MIAVIEVGIDRRHDHHDRQNDHENPEIAEQSGVFCISLSTDLSGSMGVSYREHLTKSWTVRNDFVNKRCIFQLFTLCSRFAHAIFTVLAFGPLS